MDKHARRRRQAIEKALTAMGVEARQRAFRDELAERLRPEFDAEFPPDLYNRYPSLPVERWASPGYHLQRPTPPSTSAVRPEARSRAVESSGMATLAGIGGSGGRAPGRRRSHAG